jgi:Protein of unknown function (DUF3047)
MMIALAMTLAASSPVWIGKFAASGDPPAPWRVVRMGSVKPTLYRVADLSGRPALEARVDSSMALIARPVSLDLSATPILCWRWFIETPVAKADMSRRSGDDYAARVYVAFDMPDSALSAGTKLKLGVARSMFGRAVPDAAVTYVWDNRHPVGTARKSAYTDRSQLVVAESGSKRAGTWVTERADVAADFSRAFGGKPGKPIQLAVAADGDNTKSRGRAGFADIHFVDRDRPCVF